MSEYSYVEKPFLDQLSSLGWQVFNLGTMIPIDPSLSLRSSFREVTLESVFKQSVKSINTTSDDQKWLTDEQLEDLYEEVLDPSGNNLLEKNRNLLHFLLRDGEWKPTVDENELTGEQNPEVILIDFDHPERNRFIAINQFRIDTPGKGKGHIRPDIVLFVNGLPLVVIECKDANTFTANPMHEAIKQLHRYSDQREETHTAGLKEGEPRLFYANQLLIASDGDEAKLGTITSSEDYFYNWKDIYPEKYRDYTPPLGKERQQEVLIQGLLAPETLLDVIRNCTIFMVAEKKLIKVVCRYQQYRAMLKIIERMRNGSSAMERSGVVWHTQGSGKSLTMIFAIRKIRSCDDLKDFKICMVNDRKDLEEQLGETAMLTGEKVTIIKSSEELKTKLATSSSNLNMVMIHKFQEHKEELADYLENALAGQEPVQEFATMEVVNDSDRIVCMIDEAHRSQGGNIGDNLFSALPNATRLAFTGTPLITDRHTKKTWERFGGYIDKYRLQDAVDDGATVQILYEGKTADTALNEKHEFDTKFEDLFANRTDEEILAIKKKYGVTGDIFEAEKRIEAISKDLVKHYIDNILPNGFKAQVVCNSKMAAIHYKTYIDKALDAELEKRQAEPDPDQELIKKIAFLKSAVVVSSDGTNEKAVITHARKYAHEIKAVENFKRDFNYDDPSKELTGVGFLIVCDMLLTGFDAPVEQVMYIDKKVKEHNLLQTIARVNRVRKGKNRGYIVDYVGLANHLKEALSIYSGEDRDDVENSLKNITTEIPILESRYQRLIHLFTDNGIEEIEPFVRQSINDTQKNFDILELAIEKLKDVKLRATFEVYLKKFLQSMDIVLPHSAANDYKIPTKRFGYLLAKVKQRYKDDSLNIAGAGEKVRKLINEHLISLGINPKIKPVELFSSNFIEELEKNASPKAKASEMEHAIRKHCKVRFEEDPAFYTKLSEKLETLIQKHKDNWEQLCFDLKLIRDEAEKGRKDEIEGMSATEAPFYDLIAQVAFEKQIPAEYDQQIKELVGEVIEEFQKTINIINFWNNSYEVEKLKGRLSDLMLYTGIDPIEDHSDQIVTEITALAKVRHQDIVS